jgi:hypothetical protein
MAPTVHAAGLHDPTRPDYASSAHATSANRGWRLESTLVSSRRRLAIVNGQTVHVGDRVNGARVNAIHPGSVRLGTAHGTVTVQLVSTSIKTAHSAPERQ